MKRLVATVWLVCGCLQVWGGYRSPPGHHHNHHSKPKHHHNHHNQHHHHHHHHHHQRDVIDVGGVRRRGEPWDYDDYAPSLVRVKRKAADSTQLWPDAIVPYVILSPEPKRDVVMEGLNHWEEHTCLRFVPVNDTNLPHLQFRKLDGCRSGVGIESSNGQNISIGVNCNKMAIVVHEVGHAVGLYHEIRRPDRDQHVVVNEDNILKEELFNFYKLHWLDITIQYDLSSVMHYHTLEWTSNDRTTVATRDPMLQGILGTWNKKQQGLSHRDSLLANRIYGCLDDWLEKCNLNRNPCENDGYMGSECICVCPPGTQGRTCQNVTGEYYDHLKSPCSMEITQPTTITSPNYPSTYDEGSWCVYRIEAPECQAPQITILDFQLGPRDFRDYCFYDYLEIRNTSLHDGFLLCGSEVEHGTSWSSTFSTMILFFKGDEGGYRGFKASITFVSILDCCRSYSNATLAYFLRTPGYPDPYTAAFNCSYSLPQQDAPAQLEVRVVRLGDDTSATPWTCTLILCQPHGRCRRYCSEANQVTKVRRSHRGERGSGRRRERRSYRKLRKVGWIEVEENVEEEDVDGDDDGDEWSVVLPNVASTHLMQYLGDPNSSFKIEGAAYQVSFTLRHSPCHQMLFVNRSDPRGRVRVKAEEGQVLQCEWWFQAPRGGHIKFTVEELSLPPDEDSYLAVNEAGEASFPAHTTRVYQHGWRGVKRQGTPPPLQSIDHKLSVVLQGIGPNTSLTFKYELYECYDDNVECPYWAVEGECDLNPRWMKPHCPKSCLRCDYTRLCEDDNNDCDFWADDDQCSENSVWMAVHCPRACGYCDRCGDANWLCTRWAARGECQHNLPYMATFCRKACGFCEEEIVNTTTSTTTKNTTTATTPSQGNHTTPLSTPTTTKKRLPTPWQTNITTALPHLTTHSTKLPKRKKTTTRNNEENETTQGITLKPREHKRKYKHKIPQPLLDAGNGIRRSKGRVRIRGEITGNEIRTTVTWPTTPMHPETNEVNVNKRKKVRNTTVRNSRHKNHDFTANLNITSLTKEVLIPLRRTTPTSGSTIKKTTPNLARGTTNSVEYNIDEEHHLPTQTPVTRTRVVSESPDVGKTVTPALVPNDIEEPDGSEEEKATRDNFENDYDSYGLNQRQNLLGNEVRECDEESEDTGELCRLGSDWTSTTKDEKAFIMGLIRSHRREESTTRVPVDNEARLTTNFRSRGNEIYENAAQNRQAKRERKHRHRWKGGAHKNGKKKRLPNQRNRKHNRAKYRRKRGRWRTQKQNPRGNNIKGARDVTKSPNKEAKQQQARRRENTKRGGKQTRRHRLRGKGSGKRREENTVTSQVNRYGNKRKWRTERRKSRRGMGKQKKNNSVHRRFDDNDKVFEPRPGEVPRRASTTTKSPAAIMPPRPSATTTQSLSPTNNTQSPSTPRPAPSLLTHRYATTDAINDKDKKPRKHSFTDRRMRRRKKKRRRKPKLEQGEKDKGRRLKLRQRHRTRRKQGKVQPSSITQQLRNVTKYRNKGYNRSSSPSYPDRRVIQDAARRRRNRVTLNKNPTVRAARLASPKSITTLPDPSPMIHDPTANQQQYMTTDRRTQTEDNTDTRGTKRRNRKKYKGKPPTEPAGMRKITDDLYSQSVSAKATDLREIRLIPSHTENPSKPTERYAEWGIGPIRSSHQLSRQVEVLPWWRVRREFYRRGQDVYEDVRSGAGGRGQGKEPDTSQVSPMG